MAVPDPWDVLAGTDLVLERLPIPELGRYYDAARAIVIRSGLLLVEERSVLWHELVHARRGDSRCFTSAIGRKQEASCDREAARWALPIADVAATLRWTQDLAEAADELKVLPELLQIRRDALHPSERAYLARTARRQEWAA